MSDGFIDLRPEDEGISGESFWPSFTDLMMVVLMIFMITSTVVVLRNWGLIKQLRSTMAAERAASAKVDSTSKANAALEARLNDAEQQLSMLRLQLSETAQTAKQQSAMLDARQKQVDTLNRRVDTLNGALSAAQQRADSLNDQLASLQSAHQQLQSEYAAQGKRLAAVQQQAAQLQQSNQTQAEALTQLRQAAAQHRSDLMALEGQYSDLKGKYDALVKPARTTSGKYVVEVRYEKVNGNYRIGFQEPGQSGYRVLDRAALDKRLGALSKKYPNRLYVKIIIPEHSGLSYNEAWRFTQQILDSYDYYYRD